MPDDIGHSDEDMDDILKSAINGVNLKEWKCQRILKRQKQIIKRIKELNCNLIHIHVRYRTCISVFLGMKVRVNLKIS